MVSFLSLSLWFQEKIEPSWRNYFIWTPDWGGEHSTQDTQNALLIFLSAITVMQVTFWVAGNFCFIYDCRSSFNGKLRQLKSEQIIIFYSLSNALCSSDKSVQIKHCKHQTFIGMCSLFTLFNLQILNFC